MATATKEKKPAKTQVKLQPLGDRVVVRREGRVTELPSAFVGEGR